MSHITQINANREKIQDLRLAISKLRTQTSNLYTLGWETIDLAANNGWKGSKKSIFQQQIGGLNKIKTSANSAIGAAISDYNERISELNAQIVRWRRMDSRRKG